MSYQGREAGAVNVKTENQVAREGMRNREQGRAEHGVTRAEWERAEEMQAEHSSQCWKRWQRAQ